MGLTLLNARSSSYCFVSGKRRTLVDSFLALKDTNDEGAHTYQQSASAQSAKLSLQDGVFRCDYLFSLGQENIANIHSQT